MCLSHFLSLPTSIYNSVNVFLCDRTISHTWEAGDDIKQLTGTSVFNADAWFDISVTVIHRRRTSDGRAGESGSWLSLCLSIIVTAFLKHHLLTWQIMESWNSQHISDILQACCVLEFLNSGDNYLQADGLISILVRPCVVQYIL